MHTGEQLTGAQSAKAWMVLRGHLRAISGIKGVLTPGGQSSLLVEGDILLGNATDIAARGVHLRARLQDEDVDLLRGEVPFDLPDEFRGVIKTTEAIGVVAGQGTARWPGGVVPFEVDPGLPQPERVAAAMAAYTAATSIRFVSRDPADPDHLDFLAIVPSTMCASHVGRRGGRQELYLGPQCTVGNCMHELGHALGLWHEQSREDRDDFIEVLTANIKSGALLNFDQHITDGDDIGTYDFDSIMHYPADAFTRATGLFTIKPKVALPAGVRLGQRDHLSRGDLAAIAALYP